MGTSLHRCKVDSGQFATSDTSCSAEFSARSFEKNEEASSRAVEEELGASSLQPVAGADGSPRWQSSRRRSNRKRGGKGNKTGLAGATPGSQCSTSGEIASTTSSSVTSLPVLSRVSSAVSAVAVHSHGAKTDPGSDKVPDSVDVSHSKGASASFTLGKTEGPSRRTRERKGTRQPPKTGSAAEPSSGTMTASSMDGTAGRGRCTYTPRGQWLKRVWSTGVGLCRFLLRLGGNPLVAWGLLCFLLLQEQQIYLLYHGGCDAVDGLNADFGVSREAKLDWRADLELEFEKGGTQHTSVLQLHPQRHLPPDLRSQCMYMLILGVTATALLTFGFLSHTVGYLVSTSQKEAITTPSPSHVQTREASGEEKSVQVDIQKPIEEGASRQAKKALKIMDHDSEAEQERAEKHATPETAHPGKRHTCDREQQTDEPMGLSVDFVASECTSTLPKNEGLLCANLPEGDAFRTDTCKGEPARETSSCREPETFYIGDDEGDPTFVSSAGSSGDDLLLLASASSRDRTSLLW
ncbi:putative transmembrane protein [Toxoplasma gondii VAND]|uniref:Putative transmembrane protein n=1 Tax=Toxoplasma gondii VAND TaxID=933077 RepID=A0A086PSA6_TOXGO|nr:putative transmembrane protein [Toxoplasma gondii VAND]